MSNLEPTISDTATANEMPNGNGRSTISKADLEMTQLEQELGELSDNILAKEEQLAKLKERRANQLRAEAAELVERAHALRKQADRYDPPVVILEPEEPPVLREARKNGGRVATAKPAKPAKKAPKKAAKKPPRKMATAHEGGNPSLDDMVAAVAKHPGHDARFYAEKHNWNLKRTRQRLSAASRNQKIVNKGTSHNVAWSPA